MPKLTIVAEEAIEQLDREGLPLSTLLCPNGIVSSLSARNVSLSRLAHNFFELDFDPETGLTVNPPLMSTLDDEMLDAHSRFVQRVQNNFETDLIKERQETSGVKYRCDTYTLHPVNDKDWVVGARRCITDEHYPGVTGVKPNHSFFDALMTHLLQQVSFEKLSTTNVFEYYLASSRYAR